jgi:hypothetical protein
MAVLMSLWPSSPCTVRVSCPSSLSCLPNEWLDPTWRATAVKQNLTKKASARQLSGSHGQRGQASAEDLPLVSAFCVRGQSRQDAAPGLPAPSEPLARLRCSHSSRASAEGQVAAKELPRVRALSRQGGGHRALMSKPVRATPGQPSRAQAPVTPRSGQSGLPTTYPAVSYCCTDPL